MLDPKLVRSHLDTIVERLKIRHFVLDTDYLQNLEAQRREVQTESEQLQAERNRSSREIGQLRSDSERVDALMQRMQTVNSRLEVLNSRLADIQTQLEDFLLGIPNLPHLSVPEGKNETDNLELRRVGQVRHFPFAAKDHVDLGEAAGLLDAKAGVKLTGARFTVLKGRLARLQRALIQFMLDMHTQEHGYTEVYVPYLVNADSLRGTGQLPKFADELFRLTGERPYYLIPTAEVPVTNLVRDVIVEEAELPLRWVCHTPCFRSEAGSYGKDTRGMIRQHQFEKVELVQIVKPEDSSAAHEQLTAHAEAVLQKLELPYRVVNLCGGDLGFSAAKTYDLEVWLPGQQKYREISSCSNFESFQARRLQARWRPRDGKTELVHTLNGSALAVGRTLVAILENYQDENGHVAVPGALVPYFREYQVF